MRFSGIPYSFLPVEDVYLGQPEWSNLQAISYTFEASVKRVGPPPASGLESIFEKEEVFLLRVVNDTLRGEINNAPINYSVSYPNPHSTFFKIT